MVNFSPVRKKSSVNESCGYMEKVSARAENPNPVSESGLGFSAEKSAKRPCNRNEISARAETRHVIRP